MDDLYSSQQPEDSGYVKVNKRLTSSPFAAWQARAKLSILGVGNCQGDRKIVLLCSRLREACKVAVGVGAGFSVFCTGSLSSIQDARKVYGNARVMHRVGDAPHKHQSQSEWGPPFSEHGARMLPDDSR